MNGCEDCRCGLCGGGRLIVAAEKGERRWFGSSRRLSLCYSSATKAAAQKSRSA